MLNETSKSRYMVASGLALTMTLALWSGCGSQGGKMTQTQMEQKIVTLEADVKELKAKLSADMTQAVADGMAQASSSTAALAQHFKDLNDVATRQMIDQLAQLGVFEGVGEEFKPYQKISRAEYVTWLFKAYNAIMPEKDQIRMAPQAAPKFKDLPANHSAYKYAQAMANAGYSVGYEDGTFKPDQPITREEMIGMKVGVDLGKASHPDPSQMAYEWKFSDSKDVDQRYTGYILADAHISGPHGNNIMRAFGKIGTFKPKEPVLRSEAAATLWQVSQFGDIDKATAQGALDRKAGNKS
jgi:hypothetical protein